MYRIIDIYYQNFNISDIYIQHKLSHNVLQLLSLIKYSVKCTVESCSEIKDFELTIRQIILRSYLEDYYTKFETSIYKDFQNQFLYWNKKYNQILQSKCDEISDDVMNTHFELSKNDITILDNDWIPVNNLINYLLFKL